MKQKRSIHKTIKMQLKIEEGDQDEKEWRKKEKGERLKHPNDLICRDQPQGMFDASLKTPKHFS